MTEFVGNLGVVAALVGVSLLVLIAGWAAWQLIKAIHHDLRNREP